MALVRSQPFITANSGINPFSISIIRNALGPNPTVKQIPEGVKTDDGILEACFMGLAVTPDTKTVYVAGGETNKIFSFDLATGKAGAVINCFSKNTHRRLSTRLHWRYGPHA